jgi:hypothetical protein
MNSLHTRYERQVDLWIRDAVAQSAMNFDAVVAALPGVYPTVIRDALQRVAPKFVASSAAHITPHRIRLPRTAHSLPPLPAPHPLDYDWRFDAATVVALLSRVNAIAAQNDTIIFLGTPSLLHAALAVPRSYHLALLDSNAMMVSWFAQHMPAATVQLGIIGHDPLPDWHGRVIVADPPWYEEHIQAFLWAAAQLCLAGGTILMALPPLGTRPGIAEAWVRTLKKLTRLGLTLRQLERGALTYETPLFEQNALAAEGLSAFNWSWRRGDLAVFTCNRAIHTACPRSPMAEGIWDEVCLAGVRIRLRRKPSAGFIDPTLKRLVDGHVLPSVSRRHPLRHNVDVWTAGNRVFSCAGTFILGLILQASAAGEQPLASIQAALGRPLNTNERSQVVFVCEQIDGLLAREHADQLHV